mgnify:CR=1 FL=1
MNHKIIKNFLDKSDFLNLKNFLLGEETPWYYRDACVNTEDCPYFTHNFFNNDRIFSSAFDLVQPLLDKLNYSSIIQMTKVYPEENKILIMDGTVEHAVMAQTNTKRRIVVNLNYHEK